MVKRREAEITNVPEFGNMIDFRTEDDIALDKLEKEHFDEKRRLRKEASRKRQAEDEARAKKLLSGKSRVYATKIATRSNTAWLTWTGVRAAMDVLHVQLHPIKDGGYTVSMPATSRAGENMIVGSRLSSAMQSAHRLIDGIEGSFGITVASDKQPSCAVPKCVRKGEFPTGSHPVQLICPRHSGHKE